MTDVSAATALVVTVNVAVVAPAAAVTLAGAWAAAVLLFESVTAAPPAGAGLSSVTVPVEDTPPSTDAGLTLTELSAAWLAGLSKTCISAKPTFAVRLLTPVTVIVRVEISLAGKVYSVAVPSLFSGPTERFDPSLRVIVAPRMLSSVLGLS